MTGQARFTPHQVEDTMNTNDRARDNETPIEEPAANPPVEKESYQAPKVESVKLSPEASESLT